MLYGVETWTLGRHQTNKLLSTEREGSKDIEKEKITNLKFREIAIVQYHITEAIEQKLLRWFGHLKRMGNDRIPKMTEWKAEGTRRRDKKNQWMDRVRRSKIR